MCRPNTHRCGLVTSFDMLGIEKLYLCILAVYEIAMKYWPNPMSKFCWSYYQTRKIYWYMQHKKRKPIFNDARTYSQTHGF